MSDTIKIILMVSLFAFFIYRKNFSAFLAKRKDKHTAEKNTEKGLAAVPAAPAVETAKDVLGGDSSGGNSGKDVPACYEVYAFDYGEFPETGHFADRISAKLDLIEIAMQNKRHYIKFVELGTCLLIIVKYHEPTGTR